MKLSLAMSLLLIILTATMATGHTKVAYPGFESRADSRYNDLLEILKTALEKTAAEYGPYTLQPSRSGMNEARSLAELLNPDGLVNVAWSGTSVQKEKDYRALRIPLRKGILGYRIALIAKNRQAEIDKIRNLDDLRKVSIGQGIGWGDVAIYEANGIKVYPAGYESLFKMVAANRFDLFPRGINEVFHEYAARHDAIPNLVVEKNLLIYYPWPYYFFFNKSDKFLAKRIESGIRKMMKDGSFDAIFLKYNRASIVKANLRNRRIIRIKNPTLPKNTPLNDASLWFDPAALK
ncbi:MAG: transporter substrate-binding domain-containing protein [Deltaproteobacteria bacterium]|nr:transporter substrate-binding domain-containing protein [Deltaproteobacteria bacterium]